MLEKSGMQHFVSLSKLLRKLLRKRENCFEKFDVYEAQMLEKSGVQHFMSLSKLFRKRFETPSRDLLYRRHKCLKKL